MEYLYIGGRVALVGLCKDGGARDGGWTDVEVPVLSWGNPAALWALLGVPVVLAIHLWQQRARTVRTSTLFLLSALAPESRGGRQRQRLRASALLAWHLLAVLLLAAVLGEPRWEPKATRQTVVLVLDASVRMQAFMAATRLAVVEEMAAQAGRAQRTEWVLLSSDAQEPPLYRGEDRAGVEAALTRWRPTLGTHEAGPVLQLARALAGDARRSCFITDAAERVPEGQAARGVGRPLDNVGFVGGSVETDAAGTSWRALVQNHATVPQTRIWWLETKEGRSPGQTLELEPGALRELRASWPATGEACTLVLAGDAFTPDDHLPLVLPQPPTLTYRVTAGARGGTAETNAGGVVTAGEFWQKLLGSVEGARPAEGAASAALEVCTVAEYAAAMATPGGAQAAAVVVQSAQQSEAVNWLRAPVVAEADALVQGLNWQGWIGPGPAAAEPPPEARVLLWQDGRPLVWREGGADTRRVALVFNFVWEQSNASRLPATVLLARRFLAQVQAAQPGRAAGNFSAGSELSLSLAASPGRVLDWSCTLEPSEPGRPLEQSTGTTAQPVRAPRESGFFTLRAGSGEQALELRGASQFADARQSDFRAVETFVRAAANSEGAGAGGGAAVTVRAIDWLGGLGLALLALAVAVSWRLEGAAV